MTDAYFVQNQWCKPFCGFVQNQQARVGHQRASNGQHLLLTSRKIRAQVAGTLFQSREKSVNALQCPGVFLLESIVCGGNQVFKYREVGEHLALLWYQAQAQARDAI